MKKLSVILLLLAQGLLSGCSSSFGYNNIDWLVYWYLDDYIELDKSQKNLLDGKIEAWHTWHRSEELVQYRDQLIELKGQLQQGPLSAEQWSNEFEKGRSHWVRFRDHISPDLSVLAMQISDQQVADLFAELEKNNVEQEEERNELSIEERLENSEDDIADQLKEKIGRLTNEQKAIIRQSVPQFSSTFEYWIDYRRDIQQRSLALMMQRNSLPNFSQQLEDLIKSPDDFKSSEYLAAIEHNRTAYAQLMAKINETLTPKQQKKLGKEIQELIDVIDDLIDD